MQCYHASGKAFWKTITFAVYREIYYIERYIYYKKRFIIKRDLFIAKRDIFVAARDSKAWSTTPKAVEVVRARGLTQ